MLTFKNAQAYAVLALLRYMIGDDWDQFTVEGYVNNREQGFCVKNYERAVVFSGERNSGEIVVYAGKPKWFSPQGNIPNKMAVAKEKLFPETMAVLAARYALAYLQGE